MKTELTPENLEAFRERFGTFHDGVIHSVKYDIFRSGREIPEIVTIIVGLRDWQIKSEKKWINLTFQVEHIEELVLQKLRHYGHGVIFRLTIAFFDGEVYLDFFPFTEKPTSPADFPKSSGGSRLLVIGKHCYWSVEPYQAR
jgi:hypothetical protein